MDSILNTVKKALGIDVDYHTYDTVIISHINTIILALNQIGVGPEAPFLVIDDTQTWAEYLGAAPNLEAVKAHICAQVRILFDPLMTQPNSENPNSILNTIKKMLGLDLGDDAFDTDVIININTVFMVLNQIGVGPTVCFSIASTAEVWGDFLGDVVKLNAVKSYMYLKIRVLFDPPSSSFVLDAMNRQITELEWRLNVQAEEGLYPVPPVPVPEE